MPRLKLALGQVVIGTVNFIFVAACLHQMLAVQGQASYVQTATAYVLANIAVLVTHVPGGLGVIEATVGYVLPGAASIGALVAFRVVYFLVPRPMIGLPVFAISEVVDSEANAATVGRSLSTVGSCADAACVAAGKVAGGPRKQFRSSAMSRLSQYRSQSGEGRACGCSEPPSH